jgi:SAM-dependent methyltransferase
MAKASQAHGSKQDRAEAALRLAQIGDFEAAAAAFAEAMALDSRNFDLPFNLAIVEEQLGGIDRAAQLLTTVLARRPSYPGAAARLSRLLARFQVDDPNCLEPAGLAAALATPEVAYQPIIDAACDWLCGVDPSLGHVAARIAGGQLAERDVGAACFTKRLDDGFKSELLLLCLRKGIIKHPALERLLTGARAALLLDCAPERFEDRHITDLALALMVQGWHNDHAWAVTDAETAALDGLEIDRGKLLAGEREATRHYLCAALYRPVSAILVPPLAADEAHRLKPRSLREAIEPHVRELARQQAAGQSIATLRPLADATSRKVADQYEAAPYPRWTSLHVSAPGSLKRSLAGHFTADRLAFMDGAFDVLVAGCGTGQQALQAAAAYGTGARMLAMDLSRTSLGYASDMAARYEMPNIAFNQGDILDAPLLDREFDIIECVGVLHHMADWRAGWRALLQRLKPAGLMYIGLYSAISREGLRALRREPGYPGPGCSDDAARAYRRDLLLRDAPAPGADLKISRDFYALNAFRDLVLHESEAHLSLAEIEDFLAANGLVFHGFTLEPGILDAFAGEFPASGRPGRLADWAAFELRHPRTFDAMYRFWVARGG